MSNIYAVQVFLFKYNVCLIHGGTWSNQSCLAKQKIKFTGGKVVNGVGRVGKYVANVRGQHHSDDMRQQMSMFQVKRDAVLYEEVCQLFSCCMYAH